MDTAGYLARLLSARRLAASDPRNAEWQRDLIVSHAKLAGADPQNAVAHWAEAHRIATEMQARGILAPVDAWLPGWLAEQIDAARAARPQP
jgi:hypothetical protein